MTYGDWLGWGNGAFIFPIVDTRLVSADVYSAAQAIATKPEARRDGLHFSGLYFNASVHALF
jgi:hypothetical protein